MYNSRAFEQVFHPGYMTCYKCLIIINLVRLKIVDIQNGKLCGVKADHGRDFHPLADYMIKL